MVSQGARSRSVFLGAIGITGCLGAGTCRPRRAPRPGRMAPCGPRGRDLFGQPPLCLGSWQRSRNSHEATFERNCHLWHLLLTLPALRGLTQIHASAKALRREMGEKPPHEQTVRRRGPAARRRRAHERVRLAESYYLLLILPLLFVLLRYSTTFAAHLQRTSIYLGVLILLGVAYAIFKLRQPA